MGSRARMWRTLPIGLALTACAGFCQPTPTGSISGSVQTASGIAVARATVSVKVRPADMRTPFQVFDATVSTGADGTFSVSGVPNGTYAVCPTSASADLLEPCKWGTELRVTVSGGQAVTAPPIRMQSGVDLYVRVNDLSGKRAAAEGKVPGAALLLTVRPPNGMVLHIPVTATEPGGFDHHIMVPPATNLVMGASSDFYSLTDGAGVAVSKQNGLSVPINIPANVTQHKQVINIK